MLNPDFLIKIFSIAFIGASFLLNCSGEDRSVENLEVHQFGSLDIPDEYLLAENPSSQSVQIIISEENIPSSGMLDHYFSTGYEFLLIKLTDVEIEGIHERDSTVTNWLRSIESAQNTEIDELSGLHRVYRGDIRFRWYLAESVPLQDDADYIAECMETEVGSPNCILRGILVSDRYYTELTVSVESLQFHKEISAFVRSLIVGWEK